MRRIILLEAPTDVRPPEGIIYSTRPKKALAEDGVQYYLKGPDQSVVAAEAIAYELANLVGLTVPDHGLCEVRGLGVFFASKEVRTRSGLEAVLSDRVAINPDLLSACIAFDTWIANDDRNMGNIVAEPERSEGRSRARLQAIDFEKAKILRGENMLVVGMMQPRVFWPKELLGRLCQGIAFPDEFCGRVCRITRTQIDAVFESLAWEFAGLDLSWRESAAFQLAKRAAEIRERAQEVWNNG